MSDNVTTFGPRPKKRDPNAPQISQASPNELLLTVAEWGVWRARAQAHWAKGDYETLFGMKEDVRPAHGELENILDNMGSAERFVSIMTPDTAKEAREMLRMVLTILRHRHFDPEHTLSQGPVIEIITKVLDGLAWLPGSTLLKHDDDDEGGEKAPTS